MSQGKSPVIWSPEATDDIDHLWDYHADVVGHTAADKILREIARAVATIDDVPSQDDLGTTSGQASARSPRAPKSCSIV
jgi:plasmid stabilization system protein ParE